MLFLDPNTIEIKRALQEHYHAVKCLIKKKTGQTDNSCNCEICTSRINTIQNIPDSLLQIFQTDNELQRIICSTPIDLIKLETEIWHRLIPDKSYQELLILSGRNAAALTQEESNLVNDFRSIADLMKEVIAYDSWFIKVPPQGYYSAYHLAKNLNKISCTYCNRTYTSTIETKNNGKLMRPQFDHWYDQSTHPLLALSFYNLIPCCSICNSSVKGQKKFDLTTHAHPYIDDVANKMSFKYEFWGGLNKYDISLQSSDSKIVKFIEDLHLKETYNSHQSELDDLIRIKRAYSKDYLQYLKRAFPLANLSESEIYRLAFGVELNSKDFHKRPLSKFKHDILVELGIIKNNN